MADNSTLPVSGGGTETFANDDIGGVKFPRVKIVWGVDGAQVDASASNPLPVVQTGTHNIGTVTTVTTVSAVTAISNALPAGNNNIGDVDVASLPNVTLAAGTNTNEVVGDAAHDAAAAGNPVLIGGYASAAAPSDVSGDGDAVRAWLLRNGATATVLTAAGALIGGDATNGLDVDVTRLGGVAPAFGSGANGATVLRTALATDSPGIITTGTAGSASSQVITVQGVASMTPVAVSDNSGSLTVDNGGTFAVQSTAVASEVHVGEVGGKSAVVAVTLSTDTSAYASGDLIADTQQIDAFFRKTDGTGVINSINIIDEDAQGAAIYVIFMSTSTSLGSENSAPNISDANLTAGFQGIVAVATSDYVTLSGTKVATIKNLGLPVKAVSGTDDIYIAVLNGTGTPTYTASGLEMRIGVLLD